MTTSVISGARRSRWTILAGVGAALCLAIAVASCSSGRGGAAEAELPGHADATVDDLDGTTFTAATVDGQDVVDGSVITLTFTADTIAANAGCNAMTGSYTLDDGTLRAASLAQTAMACDEALMAQDAWVADLLQAGPDATFANGVLTLEHDGVTMVLADSDVAAISVPATVTDPAAPATS